MLVNRQAAAQIAGVSLPARLIVSWAELQTFTKMSNQMLRRSIAYYGFPRPRRLKLKQKTSHRITNHNVWCEKEVGAWVAERNLRASIDGIQIRKKSK